MNPGELRQVYNELRGTARRLLRREPYDHTLESCELVNLAWARLLAGELRDLTLADPDSAVKLAVTHMRRVLLDHARRRRSKKRPDARVRIRFDDAPVFSHEHPDTFLEVDRLLEEMAAGGPDGRIRNGPRRARVARFALYGGLTESEISTLIGVPKSTVGNDVRFARAWLTDRLDGPC